jgi:MOSC domain-containing protein YiiM
MALIMDELSPTFEGVVLLAGRAAPLGEGGLMSGMAKFPVRTSVRLGQNGLEGDEQADMRFHGGPEKALHHYPFEHYAAWRAEIGEHPLLSCAGAFGENVSTRGMTEKTVSVGDVFRLGDARVEVSQGRQPCWKLNRRFGVADMALHLQQSGRTGWYYRVLEPGLVAPGDRMVLDDRRAPQWTIERLGHVFYVDPLNREDLEAVAGLDALTANWRRYARRRLDTGAVEDWSGRLWEGTPAPKG